VEIVWNEFKVGENDFRVRKLNAIDQLHVFRRLQPLLVPIHAAIKARKVASLGQPGAMLTDMVMEASKELATLSDEQLDYVMMKCLGTVEIKSPKGEFLPMVFKGTLVYQQIELPQLLQIVWSVLLENFAPFFLGLLAGLSKDEPPEPAASV